MKFRNTYDVP